MRRKYSIPILLIALFLLCAGCSWFTQVVDTPEKRALAALKTWNSQFDDTMALAKQCQETNCTEEQKDLVVKKKKWLTILKPLVDLYKVQVTSGASIPDTIEKAVIKLINEFVAGIEPTDDTQQTVDNLINKLVSEVE